MKILIACEFSGTVREAFKASDRDEALKIVEDKCNQIFKEGE